MPFGYCARRCRLSQANDVRYILGQPAQREASRSEILERMAAIQALSETMPTAQLESPDSRSHGDILDALTILSRDVCGLIEASIHPGP
jgi:hypothetical protein